MMDNQPQICTTEETDDNNLNPSSSQPIDNIEAYTDNGYNMNVNRLQQHYQINVSERISERTTLGQSHVDCNNLVAESSRNEPSDDSEDETQKSKKQKKSNRSAKDKVGKDKYRKKKINKKKQIKDARNKEQEYVRENGCNVSCKSVQPNPCLDKRCGNDCKDVGEERRQNIFDHFWDLSEQRRKDWLVDMSSRSNVKRKRAKGSSYRTNTFYYFINDGEGRRKVCKKFIIKTLDVSQRYISDTLANTYLGSSKEETRGKLVPKTKIPQIVKESLNNFILNLPALPSRYCRLYLPVEFGNVKNLYRIYKESQKSKGFDIVGEQVFHNIFEQDFNIGFHVPKKVKCVNCLEGDNCPERISHSKEIEASKSFIDNCESAKENTPTLFTSFDLQKTLHTPNGQDMRLLNFRKYNSYNLCFYESSTKNGYCYTWGETGGKKGENEIATILQKYIFDVDSRGSIKNIILYSRSSGTYKNITVLAAIHNALLQTSHVERIQINYLLPCHTGMTVDSIHSTIEKSIRDIVIWAPSQWATVFEWARKPPSSYSVEAMTHRDFKNFEELSEKYFKGNLFGKISKLRVATFKKSTLNTMTIKYSMVDGGEGAKVGIISTPKQLQQKYKTTLPITTTKYNDLKKLCNTGIIPTQFHAEYSTFSHCNGRDVLADTDIEEDIETLLSKNIETNMYFDTQLLEEYLNI